MKFRLLEMVLDEALGRILYHFKELYFRRILSLKMDKAGTEISLYILFYIKKNNKALFFQLYNTLYIIINF